MSKYQKQDLIEEDGRKVLDNALDTNYFLLNDFAKTSGKDKYPDIDGQIRLRDGNGYYLNRYLHYQLKSHRQIRNPRKYPCSREMLNYLVDTNVPTILFVVDVTKHKVYWIFLDKQITKNLNLKQDKKGRSFDLITNEVSNSYDLNAKCQKYAKEDNYEKVTNELGKITGKFESNIKSFLGLLFLLEKVEKQRLPKIFSPLLKIKENESQTIIEYLEEHQVISKTVNYFLLENEQLGIESLFNLLNSGILEFHRLYDVLEQDDKKSVLKQLSKIEHKSVIKHFRSLINDFKDNLPKFKTNDDILVHLEFLENYIHRVPDEALKIIKTIISNQKPLKPKTNTVKGWAEIEEEIHFTLTTECIRLLDKIRYLKPNSVFSLLIKLLICQDYSIQSKAKEVLKKMAEYNLFVLKKIDYQPQLFLLDAIEKWNIKKLVDLFDVVLEIARQLLSPTFEGHEMQDYKTFQIHSGPLPVNYNLKNIRERTIEILKKIYLHTKELEQKRNVIHALQEATQKPRFVGFGKDMESMVRSNTNVLIDYYISIVPNADNEIVKIIEEKIIFIRKYRKGDFPRAKKLLTLIASNTEYEIFRIFVGYDHRFSENLERNDAKDKRKAKIQEFIDDITENNYKDWEDKILAVIKNYFQLKDKGEFIYFNIFLNELAKQKPEIAGKLITRKEAVLKPFLIHLLAGIWKSGSKDHAKSLISKWVDTGKHLSVCACVFEYVKEIDKPLIDKIIKKAKKEKNTDALINIIGSIDRNYPGNKNTKTLFIDVVKELTKHSNCTWAIYISHEEDSVMKSLTKAEHDIILNNLLLAPNIGYHVEEALMPLTEKHPKQVIAFLQKRVLVQLKENRGDCYDAVPFEFVKVNIPLSKKAKIIVPEIFKWFSKKERLFYSTGCSLLHKIFPSFNDILEKELIKLVKTKSDKNVNVVFDILLTYEGEVFLHNVCKELIKTYSKNDKYTKEMFCILSHMGIVSGEYGFSEEYKKKKAEIQSWKKDRNRAIQSFVKKYEDFLDRQISFERKRAEESIELRKREFVS